MKTREKIEPGAFIKKFCISYIVLILAILALTDIIFEVNDHENVTLIRSIVMIATVILGVMLITKSIMKKNICVKGLEQSYKMYITIAIIAVAALSIFYFMYCVKSNVNKIKDTYNYKSVETFFGKTAAERLVETAADEARKSWYTVWGGMVAASAVSIPMARSIITKNTEDEEEYSVENNQD